MATSYVEAERRINRLTLAIGAIAAAIAWYFFTPQSGLGVFTGSVLAWLNARWMQDALETLMPRAHTAEEQPGRRVSAWTWIKFFGRYGLMAAVIYAMFTYLKVPLVSLLCGLLSLGAAVMVEFLYEQRAPNN